MKKALYVFAVLALCMMSACGLPKAEMADAAVSASEAATAEPATAQDAFADATADELRGMIARYQNEGDFEMVYKTARTLIEREPSDTGAYTAAMDALAAMSAAVWVPKEPRDIPNPVGGPFDPAAAGVDPWVRPPCPIATYSI